ncbi:MAG: dinitrogenase iron-molybdenum cofactor [Schaedlerella sp.]|nr:dinitrogenase iron-molybdenum cofactor [Schaedlerella sp.]
MKIAAATMGLEVSPYLEICDYYVIFDTEGDTIVDEISVSARTHNPGYLLSQGIQAIIAGSMDMGSIKFFSERNIDICINVTGNAIDAVNAYLKGELTVLPADFVSDEKNPAPHDCKNEEHEEC